MVFSFPKRDINSHQYYFLGSDVNPNPNFTRISPATRSLRLPPSVPVTSVGDLVSSSPPVDHLTSPDLLTRVHLTPPVSPARSNRDLSSRPPRDTGLSSVTSDLATVKANRRSPGNIYFWCWAQYHPISIYIKQCVGASVTTPFRGVSQINS